MLKHRPIVESGLVLALLGAIVVAYFSTIRTGHDWGGDFSMYVMNARNLLEGRPYAETGYDYDPRVTVGPRAYPPGFPALLALPIAIHGLDFEAIKRYMVAAPIAFLLLLYALARRRMAMGFALAATALTAASPMLWDIKERLLSDVPFLGWLFVTFVVADRADRQSKLRSNPYLAGLALGLLVSACIATRTIGLVLIPALIALDGFRLRKVQIRTLVALAIVATYWAVQATMLDLGSDYLRLAQTLNSARGGATGWHIPDLDLMSLPARLLALPGDLSIFWTWGNPGDPRTIAPTALVGLSALYGVWAAWRRGPSLPDVFAPLYLGALLVLPAGLGTEGRLYLPLQGLLYVYAASGLYVVFCQFQQIWRRTWWSIVPALAICVALISSYERSYGRLNYATFAHGPLAPEAVQAFSFIRNNTATDSRFVFSKPRVLALFAERRTRSFPDGLSRDELQRYISGTDSGYLLVHTLLDRARLEALAQVTRGSRQVYRSQHFHLFALDERPRHFTSPRRAE